MSAESFSRGTRDNGLRCAGYEPLADLDPRIADAMLVTLRAAGIAAYAAPSPGKTIGYGDVQLPSMPTDRLWADGEQLDRARDLLAEQTSEPAELAPAGEGAASTVDFDAAWQQVLTSLRSPSVLEPDPSWPAAEVGGDDPDLDRIAGDLDAEYARTDPADEEHYVPPPPPPLPRLRSVTVGAVLMIALGLAVLVFNFDGGSLRIPAFAVIVGGAISLVWNMRQGPPADSGWDDGAVV